MKSSTATAIPGLEGFVTHDGSTTTWRLQGAASDGASRLWLFLTTWENSAAFADAQTFYSRMGLGMPSSGL